MLVICRANTGVENYEEHAATEETKLYEGDQGVGHGFLLLCTTCCLSGSM